MHVYVDIDGTLIHESLARLGEPADGLEDFFVAARPHELFWLTTHCMDGDPTHAQELLLRVAPKAVRGDILRIRPTFWRILKTQALDMSVPFIWLDNDPRDEERADLKARATRDDQLLVEVDLNRHPDQLRSVIRDYLGQG